MMTNFWVQCAFSYRTVTTRPGRIVANGKLTFPRGGLWPNFRVVRHSLGMGNQLGQMSTAVQFCLVNLLATILLSLVYAPVALSQTQS